MGMSTPNLLHSADDLASMPEDGNRYEVIDGELFVTPAPSRLHQSMQTELLVRLYVYSTPFRFQVFAAPTAVRASPMTEVQPDLLVLPYDYPGRRDAPWERMSELVLAVEILSPSSVRVDREKKRRLYIAGGVSEYWIVDLDTRSIEVWVAGAATARVERHALVWQPVPERDALQLDLVALFDCVLDRP